METGFEFTIDSSLNKGILCKCVEQTDDGVLSYNVDIQYPDGTITKEIIVHNTDTQHLEFTLLAADPLADHREIEEQICRAIMHRNY